MTEPQVTAQGNYKDDDLVYVDPESRTVIGPVEWGKNDKPKSLPYKPPQTDKKSGPGKTFFRKYYPWGTYKSMKKIYKLEGKSKEAEQNKTLDEVLPRALKEAFWEWRKSEKD